eukprot:m.16319 g.16319  ORF g.16319 m.16319 type:complete len:303 (+) comp5662_c0_seq1:47-955(+)
MGCGESKEEKPPPRRASQKRREGISAGAVDMDAVANFEKKIVPKTDEQMELLKKTVESEVLFSHLESDELQDLLNAMYEKKYSAGDEIITQGDQNAEEFFVMAGGEVDILIEGKKVASQKEGCFGELALIYGTPRAATIKTTSDTVCFAVDRDTYRHILMGSTMKKRKMYEDILAKVEILSELDTWERSQVADALLTENFEDGTEIIKQGEEGDHFYIIIEGKVSVTQTNEAGASGQVAELGEAQFFGEIALLTKEARKATVTAVGKVKCGKLDRARFERVLGPCEEILRRNMEKYEKFKAQ